MNIKKIAIFVILNFFISSLVHAQLKEGYKAEVEIQAIGTTNSVVPFWMRSNQFGSIPLSGLSGSVIGRFSKDYDEPNQSDVIYGRKKILDWGFGVEGRANGGKHSNFQIIEGYVKAKASVFQLKVGRTKDVMGLNGDTSLSSGNFAISGNALGIPKIELSIPDYLTLPILDGIFSLKGNFSHGWIGKVEILDSIQYGKPPKTYQIDDNNPKTYFHQKSLYVRLGKKDWKLTLFGGFSHQVFWGNEKAAYGKNFALSPLSSFAYVVLGRAYGNVGIPRSKIGNQLGSIDLAIEYQFNRFNVKLYRQNFYDVGALAKLANIRDGLNGITFINNEFDENETKFSWKAIQFEFFYSKNQAGYPSSIPTNSGDEDYYNNYYYKGGWSYRGMSLGNPLITTRGDSRFGQAFRSEDFFINNRVVALNSGISGKIREIEFTGKVSYSWNYGTFGTSVYGKSTGVERFPQNTNLFKTVEQLSLFIGAEKSFISGYKGGISLALDQGRLLNNALGIQAKIIRSF